MSERGNPHGFPGLKNEAIEPSIPLISDSEGSNKFRKEFEPSFFIPHF